MYGVVHNGRLNIENKLRFVKGLRRKKYFFRFLGFFGIKLFHVKHSEGNSAIYLKVTQSMRLRFCLGFWF